MYILNIANLKPILSSLIIISPYEYMISTRTQAIKAPPVRSDWFSHRCAERWLVVGLLWDAVIMNDGQHQWESAINHIRGIVSIIWTDCAV